MVVELTWCHEAVAIGNNLAIFERHIGNGIADFDTVLIDRCIRLETKSGEHSLRLTNCWRIYTCSAASPANPVLYVRLVALKPV